MEDVLLRTCCAGNLLLDDVLATTSKPLGLTPSTREKYQEIAGTLVLPSHTTDCKEPDQMMLQM